MSKHINLDVLIQIHVTTTVLYKTITTRFMVCHDELFQQLGITFSYETRLKKVVHTLQRFFCSAVYTTNPSSLSKSSVNPVPDALL